MAMRSKNSKGNTYNPSKTKRIRKFGFRAYGANVLKRRRRKGRTVLSKSNEFGSKVEKNKKFSRRKFKQPVNKTAR